MRKTFKYLKAKLDEQEKKINAEIDKIEQENQEKLTTFQREIESITKRIQKTIDQWEKIRSKKNPIEEIQNYYVIEDQLKQLVVDKKHINSPTIIDYSFENLANTRTPLMREIESISISTRSCESTT